MTTDELADLFGSHLDVRTIYRVNDVEMVERDGFWQVNHYGHMSYDCLSEDEACEIFLRCLNLTPEVIQQACIESINLAQLSGYFSCAAR
jgi:hypothetical protein